MVPKVRVNGKMEVLSCSLGDEALALNDREMLEDLIKSAANQALEKVRQAVSEETTRMASNLGLPAGTYYVLGYQPTNSIMDGKFRKIAVKAKEPGLTIRARKGYVASPLPPMIIK